MKPDCGSRTVSLLKAAVPVWAGFLMLLSSADAAGAKRVLILHSLNRDFAPYNTLASSFRTGLAQALPEPVEFFEESLDAARLGEPVSETPFIDYLNHRFTERRPDIVVTFGAPAAQFSLRHRAQLFPESPLLMAAVDRRFLKGVTLAGNVAAVPTWIDLPGMVEHVLTVLPGTRKIIVVIGSSRLEQFWLAEMRREFQAFDRRMEFEWANELSLQDMKHRVARLPPHTAILYTLLAVDGAGVPHEQDQALTGLHAAANSPVFGIFSTQLGLGIVGGPLLPMEEITARAVENALILLRGEALPADAATPVQASTHSYDGRALERWHIPEQRLPAGSLVRFRPESPWRTYAGPILLGIAVILLQGILIFDLWAQRKRTRKAEQASRVLGARLLTVYEDERRRVARELHDDITQRLAGLTMEAARIELADGAPRRHDALNHLRAELGRLSEDVHTLSYQLHPTVLDDLGLPQALKSICDRFAGSESIPVQFAALDVPARLPRDTALCLFRIAQEALRNVARHAGATAVEVSLRGMDDGLQLAVSDNGTGFDPVETGASGHLGHASMRERIGLLGGELDIDSSPGHGTVVMAWIPLKENGHGNE